MLSSYKFKYLWLYYAYDSSKWCPWSLIFFCCHKRRFLFFTIVARHCEYAHADDFTHARPKLLWKNLLEGLSVVLVWWFLCSKLCNVCSFRCRDEFCREENWGEVHRWTWWYFLCSIQLLFLRWHKHWRWWFNHASHEWNTWTGSKQSFLITSSLIWFLSIDVKPNFNLSTDVWEIF